MGPEGPLETEAYVDSGASFSIFSSSTAFNLGINYTKGKVTYIMVGDGSLIPVFLHIIPVRLKSYSFPAQIGFSAQLGGGFNLMGQKDFFDRFIVSFNSRKRTVSFKPF